MGFSCGSVVLALVVGTCESWGPLHRLARRERLTSHVTKGPIITIPSATYDPRERYYTPENRPNVPEDYSAQQLTLNRIRECAVANKVELMRILRSGECFSRAGKKRMDGLVGQLVVASPLADPAISTVLDGKWVKQGVIGRQTHMVDINTPEVVDGEREATIMTYNWLLSGLLAVSRRHDVKEVNGDTVILDPRAARVSVCGSFNFKLPRRPLAGSTTLRVLYLDSDLQIIATDKGGDYLHPEVFVKPKGFNEQVELRMRKKVDDKGALRIIGEGLMRFIANPLKTRSPFRLRDRVAGVFRDAAEDVNDASKVVSRAVAPQKGGPGGTGSGRGIIGEVDSLSFNEAPWATEEDMLSKLREDCAHSGVDTDFVVGDLLSGKITRKLKKRGSGDVENSSPQNYKNY
jgi:hypothetical protein